MIELYSQVWNLMITQPDKAMLIWTVIIMIPLFFIGVHYVEKNLY